MKVSSLPLNRQFAFLVGVFFIVGAFLATKIWSIVLIVGAALVIAAGIAAPSYFDKPAIVWMRLSSLLHSMLSEVILLMLFFLILWPIGILRRIKTPKKKGQSYWIERNRSEWGTNLDKRY